jgi:hypothetical protein
MVSSCLLKLQIFSQSGPTQKLVNKGLVPFSRYYWVTSCRQEIFCHNKIFDEFGGCNIVYIIPLNRDIAAQSV